MSQGQFGNLCDTDNFGDPVVLYDSFEDRWVITDFAFKLDASGNVNPQGVFECFAVSMTGDPVTGGWNFYSIETPGGLGDYPKFGIWPDGIYMSANMFGYARRRRYTASTCGRSTRSRCTPASRACRWSTSPATAPTSRCCRPTPGSRPGRRRRGARVLRLDLAVPERARVYKFHVDWDKVSTSTFTGPGRPARADRWPNATSPNASTPATRLDVLAIRAMAQNQYSNIGGAESLWVTHTVRAA